MIVLDVYVRRFQRRRSALQALFIGVVYGALSGCEQPLTEPAPPLAIARPAPWFEDVTQEWGLDFTHDPGPVDGEYFMPQVNGSGAALFDFDNDGRLDIYLLQGGGPNSESKNTLFHQLPTGKFQNVSEGSGLDINGTNTGVAIGDVNNDGRLDVVVTQYKGAKMFLNLGDGIFRDATEQAELVHPYWGASTSFVDYDRDGWLDLFIVNSVTLDESRRCPDVWGVRDYCAPSNFEGSISRLYRNRGCDLQQNWLGFEDATESAGVTSPGPGLGVLCADFDGDGWPDIFVANDGKANHLWINQKNGAFQELAHSRGLAHNQRGQTQANMGVAWGDVDGDGLRDVFVTHLDKEFHGLWKQVSPGIFEEQAAVAGINRTQWRGTGWGTTLADFDQDGDLDLAWVNGLVKRREGPINSFWEGYMELNQLLTNDGTGRFRDISVDNPALCGIPNVGRGLCVGDIDGDGALDLMVTQIAGPARLLRNVAPQRGHWLHVRAVDPDWHRDAIGAEVSVQAGTSRRLGLVQPAQSFQCSNDPRVHFGLGTATKVDFIEVRWPGGSRERFSCNRVDRVVEVQRGQGVSLNAREVSQR